jgi:CheY-like chemotaxis protein
MATGPTLLVVEDDEITREGLAAVLRTAGYTVATAGDGAVALRYLREHIPPALVLLDMMMPVHDGWTFLHWQLRDPALATVPVLVMTALGVGSGEWAVGLGARGYLLKPFDSPALLHEVKRCLEAAEQRSGQTR